MHGIEHLARHLLADADAPLDDLEAAQALFNEVLNLSADRRDPLVSWAADGTDDWGALSTRYPGPAHLASLLLTATGGIAEASLTRLPKNKTEGDIPKIAITTGSADSLECLIRKIGIADSEITTSSGSGRIHLYAGNGVDKFASGFAGGSGTIPSATPLPA